MPPPTSSVRPAPAAGKAKAEKVEKVDKEKPEKADKGDKLSRPDQAAQQAEQDGLNKEIAVLRAQLDEVKAKLNLLHSPAGNENDRRSQIKAEMDSLQGVQGAAKGERQKTFDQLKRLQDGVQTKIKEVQATRGKIPYKSTEEIDSRIAQLNKQVESGTLKLIDEKKALAEISNLRRSLRTFTSSSTIEESIAADRAQIDALRAKLDDPEAKKVQARWEELKAEMDELRKEGNKVWEERGGLFDKRKELQAGLDELYNKKRLSSQTFRDANDAYYAKVAAERQLKQDRFKQQKAEEDAARREEEIIRLREEAKAPAYEKEIEDCAILVAWFNGKFNKSGVVPTTFAGGVSEKAVLEGVKKLEIRKVEDAPTGSGFLKKKDEDESGWGSIGKKKGKATPSKKASGTSTPVETEPSTSSGAINVPFSLLTALLSLSIPPPANKADVPRTISDLETKKAWYQANQAQKTKDEIARVEAIVKKMQKKNDAVAANGKAAEGVEEGEVGGEKEPLHTVAVAGDATHDVVAEQGEQLPTVPETKSSNSLDHALETVEAEEA